jgi:hypothetical protein
MAAQAVSCPGGPHAPIHKPRQTGDPCPQRGHKSQRPSPLALRLRALALGLGVSLEVTRGLMGAVSQQTPKAQGWLGSPKAWAP